jgi:hypothetical protein
VSCDICSIVADDGLWDGDGYGVMRAGRVAPLAARVAGPGGFQCGVVGPLSDAMHT